MQRVTRGLFSVWKPPDMTCQAVTSRLRRVLQGGQNTVEEDSPLVSSNPGDFSKARKRHYWLKVGHGGTLDRAAEGVLVIGVGRTCRYLSEYLVNTDKTYEVLCELGRLTDTLDRDGKVIQEAPWQHVKREDVEEALRRKFCGKLTQIPPAYSSIKVKGSRLSDIVRKTGSLQSVAPPPRNITINSIQLLTFEPPEFSIFVSCSSGTYMRSLARDIAEQLGSVGHARAVIRHQQGEFTDDTALKEDNWTIENIAMAIQYTRRQKRQSDSHQWA